MTAQDEIRNEVAEHDEAYKRDCKHKPHDLYAWTAYDGTLCICCCRCGKVLKGEILSPWDHVDMKG
jgi:hypothetical protein